MKTSFGLPNWLPRTSGSALIQLAVHAEETGFASIGTIGRTIFDSYEELVTLAACAGATERIGLATTVTIAPARDTTLLGKQVASLDALSGGRFSLGLGVGWRADDYDRTGHGARFAHRGRVLASQVTELRSSWADDPDGARNDVGPVPHTRGGPEILIGAFAPVALRRAGRLADGLIGVGVPPEALRRMSDTVVAARRESGRDGSSRLVACQYVALGADVAERAQQNVAAYYSFGGSELVQAVVDSLLTTTDAVHEAHRSLEAIGVDEVFYFPAVADPSQLTGVAEATMHHAAAGP